MKLGNVCYSRRFAGKDDWRRVGEFFWVRSSNEAHVHIHTLPLRNTMCCMPYDIGMQPPYIQGDLVYERGEEEEAVGLVISSDSEKGVMYTIVLDALPLQQGIITLKVKHHDD